MHPFRQFIHNYVTLSYQEWQEIEACLVQKEVLKDEMLLEEGQYCKHLYFLESGLLRYFVWKDGKDVTKYFTTAPYCFTSQRSFAQQVRTKDNIQALMDSTVWVMKRADAFRLLDMKNWSDFVRKLIQEVQYLTEDILEEIQNETAENRYRKMLIEEPELLQNVPLKHLASFLGIAPQSISRIRKKILAVERS